MWGALVERPSAHLSSASIRTAAAVRTCRGRRSACGSTSSSGRTCFRIYPDPIDFCRSSGLAHADVILETSLCPTQARDEGGPLPQFRINRQVNAEDSVLSARLGGMGSRSSTAR